MEETFDWFAFFTALWDEDVTGSLYIMAERVNRTGLYEGVAA